MKPNITALSLGPGDPQLMTLQTADTLRTAKHLILRTAQHPVAAWLTEQGIAYESLDPLYDQYEDFDALYRAMADTLWAAARKSAVVYAVIDAATDGSVAMLARTVPEDGKLTRLAGVTMADSCMARLPAALTCGDGLRTMPANAWSLSSPDPRVPLLICEIDNPVLASEVKLWLSDVYDDEMEVILFPSTVKSLRKPVTVPLCEIDRQRTYDHTVSVYLPAVPLTQRQRYDFGDLMEIMEILRGEDGCPWDRQQTHQSLRKYLIEEAYEAAGAIDEDDPDHLADELGDVLLQVVFHASIGRSFGDFTLSDVTTAVCRKMIRRHAHIFGTDKCNTVDEVNANWEKIKREEKGLVSTGSVLADVSIALPALTRAAKVQKKAAQVGFDWDTAIDALPKIQEEADEVRAELENKRDPAMELGDLLFSCVNVTRLAGCDPEESLKMATEKFINRFKTMENLIISDGKSLEGLTLAEMDVYWNQVKTMQGYCADR